MPISTSKVLKQAVIALTSKIKLARYIKGFEVDIYEKTDDSPSEGTLTEDSIYHSDGETGFTYLDVKSYTVTGILSGIWSRRFERILGFELLTPDEVWLYLPKDDTNIPPLDAKAGVKIGALTMWYRVREVKEIPAEDEVFFYACHLVPYHGSAEEEAT